MSNANQRCGTCARGFYRKDNGMVCCGAPVDQEAIFDRDAGVNAIWAERKYNPMRMLGLAGVLAGAAGQAVAAKVAEEPEGSDCENMHPNDGAACKMWKATHNEDDVFGDASYFPIEVEYIYS